MTSRNPTPAGRLDPRRLVTGVKAATIVGSVVGFGAVAGLVLADPVGTTSATSSTADPGATPPAAGRPAQPTATSIDDFFSPPPGFSAQPPLTNGGRTGASQGASDANGFSDPSNGFSDPSNGFGGSPGGFSTAPGMRSGGS